MADNVLQNGGFEADWGDERSHRCLIFPEAGDAFEKDVGNIFTPPGWLTWFHHQPGEWDQPEVRDSWKQADSRRVHSGQKGMLLFTFFRRHDAGFLQTVPVDPGARVRLTAWAHAWSNTPIEDHETCADDGRCSCGVGRGAAFILEGQAPPLSGDPWQDAVSNFTFSVGIDPTGGSDPFADTVVWGQGAHIYNAYAQVPPVEVEAESDEVTVFLRSKTKWPFKHNDAYWDTVALTVLEPGQEIEQPEVRLTHQPLHVAVGDRVTIEARSLTGLTNVGLTVTSPSGKTLETGDVDVGRDGDWHTWRYVTQATSEAGIHTVVFTASDGVRVAGTFHCAPDALLSYQPVEPQVGDSVTIEARSLSALTDVGLQVVRPSGAALAVEGPVVQRKGDWFTWTYTTAPAAEPGVHTVAFNASDGVAETTSFRCKEAPSPEPEEPDERGQPREQYERSYILLPPGADARWAQAVIKGAWDRFRYTVGGSADDAGIGDLDLRRVIAINPDQWPTDLEIFFEEYYPGVTYIPVEAETPAGLVEKLEQL